LFKSRNIEYATEQTQSGEPAWVPLDYNSPVAIQVEPNGLPIERLSDIKRAAQLGGGEFLQLIVEFCDALTAAERPDIPEPIEPRGTDSSEVE
jgi:hypothetical protein